VYERLGLCELRPTKIVLQLVDRSTRLLMGVVDYVLIKLREFIFPVDFVTLNIEKVSNAKSHISVIFGWPFLAISNALSDCKNGMTKLSFWQYDSWLEYF